jgi:hypothetical protein
MTRTRTKTVKLRRDGRIDLDNGTVIKIIDVHNKEVLIRVTVDEECGITTYGEIER